MSVRNSRTIKPSDVVITAEKFFQLEKENAADRPSAFLHYCSLMRIRCTRELSLRELEESEMDFLEKFFRKLDSSIPPALISNDWDT
jgi:hypothetical protein